MIWKISSSAAPTAVHPQSNDPATDANIANGTGAPGFCRFHTYRFTDISATQIQEPTTTSTTPM